MKRAIMLIIVISLFISACDRFDHDVYSNANLEESFMEFDSSLSTANAEDVSGIMNWYSDDYLNDAETKIDIEHEYLSYYFEYGDDLMLNAMILEYWKTNRIVFEIWGTLADSTFVIAEKEDHFIISSGDYKFYGNQVSPPPLNPELPVVMVQYFTATNCGNCPLVGTKLEEMHNELGEQIVVLEYVNDEDPGDTYMPEALYYGAGTAPTSILQGDYTIISASEASLAAYQSRYDQALSEPLIFRFTSLELATSGDTVIGTLTWEELGELSGENLQLRSVLLEEEPDLHYIDSPVYFANYVIGGAAIDYDGTSTSAEISVTSGMPLPEKWSMVVWLQDRVANASANGAHIYNVIKKMGGE
ncbi:MAG: hypothetical protein P9M05_11555 [Candidatus Stygibacter australis]|nr:hypothetical protein [Candidatus Stygibacter australis]